MISFKVSATIVAFVFAIAAVGVIALPEMTIGGWGVEATPEARFVARRLGAGFIGFTVILLLARNAGPSTTRRALALGIATALLVVAGIGIFEFFRGFASAGILSAVLVELVSATLLILSGYPKQ